jgi:hypothetical protein
LDFTKQMIMNWKLATTMHKMFIASKSSQRHLCETVMHHSSDFQYRNLKNL